MRNRFEVATVNVIRRSDGAACVINAADADPALYAAPDALNIESDTSDTTPARRRGRPRRDVE